MSKHPPAYQYYAADFEAATRHWTPLEVGCYQRLLNHQWINGSLPPKRLWRIAGVSSEDWPELWETLSEKFQENDGKLTNRRLEVVRQQQQDYRLERAESGRRGGLATQRVKAELQAQVKLGSSKADSKPKALQSSSSSLPTTSTTTSKKKKRAAGAYSPDFERWWAFYPEKSGKGVAYTAWEKLGSSRPSVDALIGAMWRYRHSDKVVEGFVVNPRTWLSQRRFDDDPTPYTKTGTNGDGSAYRQTYPNDLAEMKSWALRSELGAEEKESIESAETYEAVVTAHYLATGQEVPTWKL